MAARHTIKLTIEYNGESFHGFQRQGRALLPTVQGSLEQILSRLTGAPIRVAGAGRTDAGVHALAQVVHFRCADCRMGLGELQQALNANLAPSLVVVRAEEVPYSFHARHSALSRRYRYVIHNRRFPSPTLLGRCLHEPRPLNLESMRSAARHLLGTRDFSAFRTGGTTGTSSIRHLGEIVIRHADEKGPVLVPDGFPLVRATGRDLIHPTEPNRVDCPGETIWPAEARDLILMDFEADSFLRGMVRMMVGTLLRVGRNQLAAEDVASILASLDSRLGGPSAPPHGLYLVQVHYPPHSVAGRGGSRAMQGDE